MERGSSRAFPIQSGPTPIASPCPRFRTSFLTSLARHDLWAELNAPVIRRRLRPRVSLRNFTRSRAPKARPNPAHPAHPAHGNAIGLVFGPPSRRDCAFQPRVARATLGFRPPAAPTPKELRPFATSWVFPKRAMQRCKRGLPASLGQKTIVNPQPPFYPLPV